MLIALFAMTIGALSISPVHAAEPEPLGAGYITDRVSAFTEAEISSGNETLEKLRATSGYEFYIVVVDNFGSMSSADWADTVGDLSLPNQNQLLLAVSISDRQYYISRFPDASFTKAQLDEMVEDIRPTISAGKWAQLPQAISDSMASQQKATDEAAAAAGRTTMLVVGVLVVGAIALVIFFSVRKRQKAAAAAAAKQEELALLTREAGVALVQTDDAVKTSLEELGFAKAQFGDESTAEFEQAIADAKKNLDVAFDIKQKLDDEIPDTEEQIRQWTAQMMQMLGAANQNLDEKSAAFDELRKLEADAPGALARVTAARDAITPRVQAAAQLLAQLQQQYDAADLKVLANYPGDAVSRLEFATEEITNAQEQIAAGKTGPAAVDIRAAEGAIAQADQLVAALTAAGPALQEAAARAVALIAELNGDIATAATVHDQSVVAPVVAQTQQAIQHAQTLLSATPQAPGQAALILEAANTQIDAVVARAREEQAARERMQREIRSTIDSGYATVRQVNDFISTRRGAIGSAARTRLSQAEVALSQAEALAQTDPANALQNARLGVQRAQQAMQEAQSDYSNYNSGGGDNLSGAILGGIILNGLLGGGGGGHRSSGGFGGGFGGSRGGGFGAGSFGGSGSSGRRGGGGGGRG